MYRRAIFESIGEFDRKLPTCEDYDMYLRIARGHSVHSHNQVVAEYRRHDAAMSMDPERMLRGALDAFAGQSQYLAGRPDYLRAQREGIKSMRRYAPQPLLKFVLVCLKTGRFRAVLRLFPACCALCPRGCGRSGWKPDCAFNWRSFAKHERECPQGHGTGDHIQHARFVTQALDSALGKRKNLVVEILVREDCYTEGKREKGSRLSERIYRCISLLTLGEKSAQR